MYTLEQTGNYYVYTTGYIFNCKEYKIVLKLF